MCVSPESAWYVYMRHLEKKLEERRPNWPITSCNSADLACMGALAGPPRRRTPMIHPQRAKIVDLSYPEGLIHLKGGHT